MESHRFRNIPYYKATTKQHLQLTDSLPAITSSSSAWLSTWQLHPTEARIWPSLFRSNPSRPLALALFFSRSTILILCYNYLHPCYAHLRACSSFSTQTELECTLATASGIFLASHRRVVRGMITSLASLQLLQDQAESRVANVPIESDRSDTALTAASSNHGWSTSDAAEVTREVQRSQCAVSHSLTS